MGIGVLVALGGKGIAIELVTPSGTPVPFFVNSPSGKLALLNTVELDLQTTAGFPVPLRGDAGAFAETNFGDPGAGSVFTFIDSTGGHQVFVLTPNGP